MYIAHICSYLFLSPAFRRLNRNYDSMNHESLLDVCMCKCPI